VGQGVIVGQGVAVGGGDGADCTAKGVGVALRVGKTGGVGVGVSLLSARAVLQPVSKPTKPRVARTPRDDCLTGDFEKDDGVMTIFFLSAIT
jgi:hypothetical protein